MKYKITKNQKPKKLYRSAKPKRCALLHEVYKNIASIISKNELEKLTTTHVVL